MFKFIKSIIYDIDSVFDRDPAARNRIEVFLLYPHINAIISHKISHFFYTKKLFFIARLISNISRFITGIEIALLSFANLSKIEASLIFVLDKSVKTKTIFAILKKLLNSSLIFEATLEISWVFPEKSILFLSALLT